MPTKFDILGAYMRRHLDNGGLEAKPGDVYTIDQIYVAFRGAKGNLLRDYPDDPFLVQGLIPEREESPVWEYRERQDYDLHIFVNALNEAGKSGWELVSVVLKDSGEGNMIYTGFLKRQKKAGF